MNTELMFSSKSHEWATPQDLFDQLDDEFRFTLDAAGNLTNRKVGSYYGPDHPDEDRRDGLTAPWIGRVWCNPPYGRGIGEWVSKAWSAAHIAKTAEVVVMLLPARTDTKWFHEWVVGEELRFLRGRLKFGGIATPAPFPSLIAVFRPLGHREGGYSWSVL